MVGGKGTSRGHGRCPAPTTTSQQTHNGKVGSSTFCEAACLDVCVNSSILNVSNSEMLYGSATTYLRLKQASACRFAICFKLSSYLAVCVRRVPLRVPKTDCAREKRSGRQPPSTFPPACGPSWELDQSSPADMLTSRLTTCLLVTRLSRRSSAP